MEQDTLYKLEAEREIEELRLTVKNLRVQLGFSEQQLRTLRVRAARYENVLGMEDYQEAA